MEGREWREWRGPSMWDRSRGLSQSEAPCKSICRCHSHITELNSHLTPVGGGGGVAYLWVVCWGQNCSPPPPPLLSTGLLHGEGWTTVSCDSETITPHSSRRLIAQLAFTDHCRSVGCIHRYHLVNLLSRE